MQPPSKSYYFTPHLKKSRSRKNKEKKIFVQEWGNPNAPAVLFIHGFPGCGHQGQLMMTSEYRNKIRLITIDRPGYGDSSRQTKITPLIFARQLETLLDFLEIEKVRIISVSGGAPYALALAYILKERAVHATSIGGIAPLTRKNFRFLNQQQRKSFLLRKFVPGKILDLILGNVIKAGFKNIEKLLFTEMESFSEADRKVFGHPEIGPFLSKSLQTSLKQGAGGLVDDMSVYTKNWGYSLQKITCPVTLWHGAEDDVVHLKIAEEMRTYLSHSQLKVVPREGHYSILMNCRDQIIKDILGEK